MSTDKPNPLLSGRHCYNIARPDSELLPGGPWCFNEAQLEFMEKLNTPLRALSKKKRSELIYGPSEHPVGVFYTLWEGLDPARRISKTNPPARMHGLTLDFDVEHNPDTLNTALERRHATGLPMPSWIELSFSNKVHAAWFLSEPLSIPPNATVVSLFLSKLEQAMHFPDFYPGYDPASLQPHQFLQATGNHTWIMNDSDELYPLLEKAMVESYLTKALEEFGKQYYEDNGMTPEEALPLLQQKYPNMDWSEEFKEGSMGPTFWLEGSVSPKSAKVFRAGIYSFSDTAIQAEKQFYSWADLLGSSVVNLHGDTSVARKVENVYVDPKNWYYVAPPAEGLPWKVLSTEKAVRRFLAIQRGVKLEKPKPKKARRGEETPDRNVMAEIDHALNHIEMHQQVASGISLAYQPMGIIPYEGYPGEFIVNTSIIKVMQADHSITPVWGPDGAFPDVARFWEHFWPVASDGTPQLSVWLAWLKRFYIAAKHNRMNFGHVPVIVGDPGVGKTFMIEVILKSIFGSIGKAAQFLLGDTNFNYELFSAALWTLDDVAAGSADAIRVASNLKTFMTQTTHRLEAKFRPAVNLPWRGRGIICCNPEPESLSVLPPIESGSNADKFLLLRTCGEDNRFPFEDYDRTTDSGESVNDLEGRIKSQLPYFLAWLEGFELPEFLSPDSRFGFKRWHNPEVLDLLEVTSKTYSLVSYLNVWRVALQEEFKKDRVLRFSWMGLKESLAANLASDMNRNEIQRMLGDNRLAQRLVILEEQGKFSALKRKVGKGEDGDVWELTLR